MSAERATRRSPRRDARLSVTADSRRVVGTLDHDTDVMILTHGQVDLSSIIGAILDQTGPARVSIATWTLEIGAIRTITRHPSCATVRILAGNGIPQYRASDFADLVDDIGADAIRTARLHSKWVTIRNDEWHLAVRTSANLTGNPRLEYVEISDCVILADFLDAVLDQVWSEQPSGVPNGRAR
jgi:hypothetical protein